MKHTEDIILKLLQIRAARKLAESGTMSDENLQKLRELIAENRRQVPSFALAHFDRLESAGQSGLAETVDGKCKACGADIAEEEIEYLKKNKNIGVCDSCFAFVYMPNENYDLKSFFKDFLSSQ